jgi:hypothetical protein
VQQALERIFGELLFGPTPGRDDLAALCARHALPAADAAALLDSYERLLVYRDLSRSNLREALLLSIPRTIARLEQLFDEYFDRFLAERGPRTHYLRDVTPELLAFCRPLWASDPRVPSYVAELALHESLHIEVSALPALPRDHRPGPLALDQGVDFTEALRLVQHGHAVHELDADVADRAAPSPRPVSLLVYRSPDHEVRYLELSALAHALLQRLLAGDALGVAVQSATAATGSALTEGVLSGAAKLLADLAERGVIRGPKPPASPASGPTAEISETQLP